MEQDIVQTITQLVSNLGFPIACACALFWQNAKSTERFEQLTQKWMDIISANTNAIDKLSDRMDS